MKAIAHVRYGRPNSLELRDVDVPEMKDDQVLLRVHASSVNPVEWYGVTGFIAGRIGHGLRRPKRMAVGADVAGRIEAVGKTVTAFGLGDEVFGTSGYSWAEYAVASPNKLALKPASVSFEEAAAVPVAGLTALQALRDHGRVEPGQKVLINGASGGVGTFAVQLAKVFGADVTAVCSTRNVEQARSLGADRVVDYTREDFTRTGERHDLFLDIAGSRSFLAYRRVLTPTATVVLIGGPMTYRGLGPLPHIGGTILKSKGRSQTVKFFVAKIQTDDLTFMAELLAAGKVKSVIERAYPLSEAREALAHLGTGHARAKVVITV
ncbi:MAG TPA: NAD(P)-dependent alcohol dehydrogenase [Gaiellaceae bacterium]|jgi:NADPH:quinone reductase-like Zn-dependent oxidoreductase|nr:NAD(P)-dependent alcohol dehydrogenase [Gaiellaceae bacterium]